MRKTVLLASAALGAMFIAAPAMAQDVSDAPQAEAVDDGFGDAIVVTARRRAEDVSKVPIAITAFSGEQLVAKGISNTYDLTKVTPGLNIAGGGSKTNPFIVIRGQSKTVTGNGSPGVITYMNDVPLPGNGSLIQTYDMENIQVLKGPQGTLFGRNSIGGAVLTVTKGPSHEFGGYVAGELASHDFKQVEGAVNVPIVKDVIALRLAAQVSHDGGDIKTYRYSPYTITKTSTDPDPATYLATPGQLVPGSRNVDEFATESYRASLLIEPTDWFKNVTVGDYSKIRGLNNQTFDRAFPNGVANNGTGKAFYYLTPAQLTGAFTPSFGAALAAQYAGIVAALAQCPAGTINCNLNAATADAANATSGRYNYTLQDPWASRAIVKGISNTTTIKLGDNHQLKNIFAIRIADTFTNSTLTGLAIPAITTSNLGNLRQTTEEIQLSGSFLDNDLKYTVGGFFYNEKPNGIGGFQALEVNAFMGLSHSLVTTYLHNSSKAVYGQVDYSLDKLIPGLNLTAGLRQTWDTQSACATSQSFSPFKVGTAMVLTDPNDTSAVPSEETCRTNAANVFADAKFKKLTYTLGANWQISPDAMIYVAHRRGYRAGGYNTPKLDLYLADFQTYRPETLTDWELGTKLRFASGDVRGTLDLAVFTGKDTDNQLPANTSGATNGKCVVEALGTPGHLTSDCNVGTTPGALVKVAGSTNIVNGASLTIRGFEAAATLSPFRGLAFNGSLAYTQVRVDSITLSPTSPMGLFLAANGFPLTAANVAIQGQPTWTSNAGVTVDYPEKILGGDLTASLDYHYNGSYRSSSVNVPSWHQIDMRVGLRDIGETGLDLAVYVKNLTNETTYQGTGASSPASFGIQSYILGKSRTVGMRVAYKFGAAR